MAETYKESIDAINAIGNEFVDGVGGGTARLAEVLGLDNDELFEAILEDQPAHLPEVARALFGTEVFAGFTYGVRWERSRHGE